VNEAVRRFYDRLAPSYHLIYGDWEAVSKLQASSLRTFFEKRGSTPGSVHVLDCACGIGTEALGLASLGFQLTGCDISPCAVERTRREAEKRGLRLELLVADMLDLSQIPDGKFDAVICMDNALSHCENDEQLFRAAANIRRKLRPEGIFLASIADFDRLIQERPTGLTPAFYFDRGRRRIVHQLWDWIDERRYNIHLYIAAETQGRWEVEHHVTQYRSVLRSQLGSILRSAGFVDHRWIFEVPGFISQCLVSAINAG
jgi:SAM-dependent methyltransferase